MHSTFDEAYAWVNAGQTNQPHLLLGNGFSMAYDPLAFSYSALADRAESEARLPDSALRLMKSSGNRDFESAMRQLEATADTLEALDASAYAALIAHLRDNVAELREALAHSIAGLHPERPYDIADESYARVRQFLDAFKNIYTVSYDLLLYWTLMQDIAGFDDRASDDGFRDSQVVGDTTVLWNMYTPYAQNVHYLHGALHLFQGNDGLRKITWVRTFDALIDQVRRQLALRRYPLYVAEGESNSKLDRISGSAYLSRSLRSLASSGGGLLVYGHSLDPNDDHIFEAVVRSKVTKLAVSLYGDPNSSSNQEVVRRTQDLITRRNLHTSGRRPLEVATFDAGSLELW